MTKLRPPTQSGLQAPLAPAGWGGLRALAAESAAAPGPRPFRFAAERHTCAAAAAVSAVVATGTLWRRKHRPSAWRQRRGARVTCAAVAEDAAQEELSGGSVEEEPAEKLPEEVGSASASAEGPAAALQKELLELAAATNRGQTGDESLRQRCEDVIAELEAVNPTGAPARSPLLEGRWRLIFASEDPTRCSPFFWALRDRMRGAKDPNPLSRALFGGDDLLDNTLAFTDGVPIKTVGLATQELRAGELVNQVVVGVFPTGESKMTTTCQYAPDAADSGALAVTVEKTQVLGASLAANILDQLSFPSGEALGDSATVSMQVTYLDGRLRIVRDARRQKKCFVFSRI